MLFLAGFLCSWPLPLAGFRDRIQNEINRYVFALFAKRKQDPCDSEGTSRKTEVSAAYVSTRSELQKADHAVPGNETLSMWTAVGILAATAAVLFAVKVWRAFLLNKRRFQEWERYAQALDARNIRGEMAQEEKRSFEEFHLGMSRLWFCFLKFFFLTVTPSNIFFRLFAHELQIFGGVSADCFFNALSLR